MKSLFNTHKKTDVYSALLENNNNNNNNNNN